MRKAFLMLIVALFPIMFSTCAPIKKTETVNSNYLALTNCNLIDGIHNEIQEQCCVLIKDNKIHEVFINTPTPTLSDQYQIIDMTNKYILPGFINTHVHNAYNEAQLEIWLNTGVTTVRDMFAISPLQLQERDALNTKNSTARLVSASGMLSPIGGYGNEQIESMVDAKTIIDLYNNANVDVIKIAIEDTLAGRNFTIFLPEEIKVIVNASHQHQLWVAAHITHAYNIPMAIDAGIDEIAHMIVEPLSNDLLQRIVDEGIYFIPTLELWQLVSEQHTLDWNSVALDNLNRFYKLGGNIALGTDFAGYSGDFDTGFPITEIKLMEKAGMSVMDIIIASTKNAAIVCGKGDEIGTIESGKYADLLIIDENPLLDTNAFLTPVMVIHNGKIISSLPMQ